MNLDDRVALERADPHAAHAALAGFPAQCRAARALAVPPPPVARPRAIVLAGMGGSAAGADLVAACGAERLDVPIVVHRGYGLPAAAGPAALVLASSYSGDTVETVSALETALRRGAPAAAIASGGALAALAERHALPLVRVPGGLMPRMALGYLLFPALALLAAAGAPVATAGEIDEAIEVVDGLVAECRPERPAALNDAKRLARELGGRLPAVYGGPLTGGVAYRWKTELEENAKTLALAGALPEVQHNEIEAWRAPAARGVHAVLLRDAGEPPEVAQRFAILRDMLGPAAGGVSEAWSRGHGPLARLLSLACLGAWVSYYLALLRSVDPWAVPALDEVKRRVRDGGAPRA
jgi:glucose/mannose-6-phosphate isomerase